MSSLLERLTHRGDHTSAETAKERLKLVLTSDRSDLGPELLNNIKDEIVQVLSRHIDVDPSMVDLHISAEGRKQRLVADIPFSAMTRRRRAL